MIVNWIFGCGAKKKQDVPIYSDFGVMVRTEVVHEWVWMVLVM